MRRYGRGLLALAALLLAAAIVALLLFGVRRSRQPRPPSASPSQSPAAIVAAAPAAKAVLRIERQLASDRAFRDDLLFLIIATVRDRCQPAQAGLLARMANRASLPVLAAVNALTTQQPDLDRPIYQYIQHRADRTACGEPLSLPAAQGGALQIDLEQYARTFPDSYYEPQRSSVPRDLAGASLAERAGNACNTVVYSVLPLGGSDWRCSALRAQARLRVRGLCEDEVHRQHGRSGGELDMAIGQGMEPAVVRAMAALPPECR